MICLITLDRLIVLRFPFTQLRFRHGSALLACGCAWLLGLTVTTVPLLPGLLHWRFYQQTGVCLPLPITRRQFPGQTYSFTVMIVVNFVLFLAIACGQAAIYLTVSGSTKAVQDVGAGQSKARDMTLARRLLSIVVSDFLCWFPIGVLGLVASGGAPIPGQVDVIVAIFVMPLNSALNPFLYTLSSIMEKARTRRYNKLVADLEVKIRNKIPQHVHNVR